MRAITPAVVCFSAVVAAAHVGSRPLFAVTLVLSAMAGVRLIRSRRLTGFEVLIVAVPTFFYPPVPGKFIASLADPLMLALAAALLLARREDADDARRAGAHLVLGWAFAVQLVALSSLVWPLISLRGASLPAGVSSAVKLALMAMFVLVAYRGASDSIRREQYRFLDVWADTATAVALVGIGGVAAYYAGIDLGLNYDLRATGTFADPNAFGVYLLISVGVVMAASYRRRGSAVSWRLVPIAVALLMTGSRATFAALVVALVLTALIGGAGRAGSRFRLAAAGTVAAAVVVVAALPSSLTGASVGRAVGVVEWDNPDDNRFALWAMAFEMWQTQPYLGIGIGQFRTASLTLLASPTAFFPHSTYLGLLAEIGLVGVLVVLALPVVVSVGLLAARFAGRPLATFFLFSMISFAVEAATLNLENFRPFWTFLGITLALVVAGRSADDVPHRTPARPLLNR